MRDRRSLREHGHEDSEPHRTRLPPGAALPGRPGGPGSNARAGGVTTVGTGFQSLLRAAAKPPALGTTRGMDTKPLLSRVRASLLLEKTPHTPASLLAAEHRRRRPGPGPRSSASRRRNRNAGDQVSGTEVSEKPEQGAACDESLLPGIKSGAAKVPAASDARPWRPQGGSGQAEGPPPFLNSAGFGITNCKPLKFYSLQQQKPEPTEGELKKGPDFL